MNIKKIMQVAVLLLSTGTEALYASQDASSIYKLSSEDQQILENLNSIRESMGMPPLSTFDFSLKDGIACQLRYLSANQQAVPCDSSAQIEARRSYQRGCVSRPERWQSSVSPSAWMGANRNWWARDFISTEDFDCNSGSMVEAVEQILGNPYKRIHILQPYTTHIGWSEGVYKQKPAAYGINSRFLTREYYYILFGEQPALDEYYNLPSYGVAHLQPQTWTEKLEEYCMSAESEESDCAEHINQLVSNFSFSLSKLEMLFSLKTDNVSALPEIVYSHKYCKGKPYLEKFYCPKIVEDLRPLMKRSDVDGDFDEAFFALRDEFIAGVSMLNSVMSTATPFYVYPFSGSGEHTFLTHASHSQLQDLPIPAYVIQGLPITVQFDETSMKNAAVHTFSLVDEHGNHIPVMTEKHKGDAWFFYPLRRYDRATQYTVSMGYKADDYAEGPHDVKWSFTTKGADTATSRLYRLGDKQWNDMVYSRESTTDWVSAQSYAIDKPADGELVTIDVRPTVAEEVEVTDEAFHHCDGWQLIRKDAGGFTVQAGRGACGVKVTGITRPLKIRMETLKPDWLSRSLHDDNSGTNPGAAIDHLGNRDYWGSIPEYITRLDRFDKPGLTEYRTIQIEFGGDRPGECISAAEQVFDCEATDRPSS